VVTREKCYCVLNNFNNFSFVLKWLKTYYLVYNQLISFNNIWSIKYYKFL
jgi:hypothetical protein